MKATPASPLADPRVTSQLCHGTDGTRFLGFRWWLQRVPDSGGLLWARLARSMGVVGGRCLMRFALGSVSVCWMA